MNKCKDTITSCSFTKYDIFGMKLLSKVTPYGKFWKDSY